MPDAVGERGDGLEEHPLGDPGRRADSFTSLVVAQIVLKLSQACLG